MGMIYDKLPGGQIGKRTRKRTFVLDRGSERYQITYSYNKGYDMIVQCYIINCEDSFDMILFSNLLGFVYIYLYTFIHSSRHSSPINMTSLLCLWSYEKLFFTCKFDNKLFTLKLSCVCPMYTRNKRKYVYIGFFNLFFSSSICC